MLIHFPISKVLGSSYGIKVDNKTMLTATLNVNGENVIPTEIRSLTKSGKLSIKPMPKNKFYEIYQDYVCGSALRIARELFALLPVDMIIVNAIGSLLNKQTGHLEDTPILSIAIPRKTFDMLNFENLDPSDSLNNFVHNMDFKKGKGFGPVEVLDASFTQKSNATIQPSQDNSESKSINLLKKSIALLNKGKFDQAFYACEEAIRCDPQSYLAWCTKGMMLLNQGQNEEAIKAFDEAIKLNPSYAEAWNNKGIVLLNQGLNDKALNAFDEAIKLNPSYAEAWLYKGGTFFNRDLNEEAIKAFDEAIKLNPSYAKALYCKGAALKSLGRNAEADAYATKAKELGYEG